MGSIDIGLSELQARTFKIPYGPKQVFDNFKFAMIFIIEEYIFPCSIRCCFKNVPKTLIESAKVLGASNKDIFQDTLPGAGPNIVNGLRGGLGSAWVAYSCRDVTRKFVRVGYMITHAYELARTDLVITGIICID